MRLVFILLIIFNKCYGQISISEYSSGYQTLGIGSISSKTYEAGKVYIIFAGTTNTTTPATVSISGGSTTWTEINNIVSDGSTMRLQAFRYAPSSNQTTALTITYTGSQTGGFCIGYEISGVSNTGINGSNAIVQSVTDAIDASANPVITMSTIYNSRDAVLVGFINNSNPFTGTAESGWTETNDGGYATPDTGGYVMFRLTTTDNTPTVTASSSNWAGIAIELRGSRRSVVIN